MNSNHCHHETATAGRSIWRNRLFLVTVVVGLLFASGWIVPPLKPFQPAFLGYVKMIWWALLVGFLVAGVIERYIPAEYISRLLARPRKRTILYATFLGLLMSACSHGILAIAIQLHKKGASGPAVISFLLASPWANLPVTLLLIGLFGVRGLEIIVAALAVSILTGLFFLKLDRKGWIESNPGTVSVDTDFSVPRDLRDRWRNRTGLRVDVRGIFKGARNLADMILWWILIGISLAALIGAFLPHNILPTWFGPSLAGLLLTLGVATVIEICSEGSAPLAFEIYRQTGSLGNSFAFLMGGVVTDYTEIGLVWTQIGKRTALWMVAVTVPQVLLIGFLMNLA